MNSQYVETGVLDRTHLRFFTRKSMLQLFEETGYEVTAVEPVGISTSLKPRALAVFSRAQSLDTRAKQYIVTAKSAAKQGVQLSST